MKFHVVWIEVENPHKFAVPRDFNVVYVKSDITDTDTIELMAMEKLFGHMDSWALNTTKMASVKIKRTFDSEKAYDASVAMISSKRRNNPKPKRKGVSAPINYVDWLKNEFGK